MIFSWVVDFISEEIVIDKWEKSLRKRCLCVTEDNPESQYPNSIWVDFLNDKIELLSWISVGDKIDVYFSTSYNNNQEKGIVFNSIRGWRIHVKESAGREASADPTDDLPF